MAHTYALYVALSNIRAHDDDDRIFLFFIFSSRRPFVLFFLFIYLFIFILFFIIPFVTFVCRAAVVFNTKRATYVCVRVWAYLHTYISNDNH